MAARVSLVAPMQLQGQLVFRYPLSLQEHESGLQALRSVRSLDKPFPTPASRPSHADFHPNPRPPDDDALAKQPKFSKKVCSLRVQCPSMSFQVVQIST